MIALTVAASFGFEIEKGTNFKAVQIILFFTSIGAVLGNQWSIYSTAKIGFEAAKGKVHYAFFANGFRVSIIGAKSEIQWNNVIKVLETRTDFLLYPQKNLFWLIPMRAFQTQMQRTSFKKLLHLHLGEKAKLR